MQMIKQRTVVLPSHPPFLEDHTLSLSHLDTDPNVAHTFRFLRAYTATTTTHTHNPFHVISSSLSKALCHYYPLAATLRHRQHPDRRLELWCTAGQGVPLIHATVDFTLNSVNYFDDPSSPSSLLLEQLVPDPEPEEGMKHPTIIQLTVFKCGGFTLGVTMHHSICDGLGGNQFFNAMAELAPGSTQISVEPVWDRERFLGPRNPPRVDSPLISEFLYLDNGFSPDKGGGVRECFHVRDDSLDKFKRSLFHQSGFNFTTFEALSAYIWRFKIKALGVKANEKVKLGYSINIRRLVKPPLPTGYWGNACVLMFVQLSAKELIERPIWEIAELIRKSKSDVSDEYVQSFIDYQELHFAEGITAGKWLTRFVDWRHLGHSTMDYGRGSPVTVLRIGRNNNDPCYFLPYSTASAVGKKEGFKVLVTLMEAALPAFREDMQLFSNSQEH